MQPITPQPEDTPSQAAGSGDAPPSSHEARLSALRSLAAVSTSSTVNDDTQMLRTAPSGRSIQRTRLFTVLGVCTSAVLILAVAIIALVRAGALPFAQHAQPPAPTAISFFPALTQHLECPHDASWSPDGRLLALVGYDQTCLNGATGTTNPYAFNMLQPAPGLIDIIKTSTGASITALHPDQIILQHVTLPTSVTALLGNPRLNPGPLLPFNYTHILWSRDSQRIALTFNSYIPTGPPPPPTSGIASWPGYQVDGVIVMGADGSNPQVLMHRFDPDHPLYTEWDLSAGVPVATSPTLHPLSAFSTILPAARYQWGADGALTIAAPLASDGLFGSATGAPSGGATFAIWQPGYAIPLASATAGATQSGLNGFFTDIAAWSPDGRYLLERATIETLVSASGTIESSPRWPGSPAVYSIAPGLGKAFALFGADADLSAADFLAAREPIIYSFPVAWNPNGSRVAAYSLNTGRIAIFDTQSGKRVALITAIVNLNATQIANTSEPVTLRWSPDGSRLFLYDPAKGAATIFPVPQRS